jgi:hypothetical protein
VDWIGDGAKPYEKALKAWKGNAIESYVDRMATYFDSYKE